MFMQEKEKEKEKEKGEKRQSKSDSSVEKLPDIKKTKVCSRISLDQNGDCMFNVQMQFMCVITEFMHEFYCRVLFFSNECMSVS
jgi:hypothetical protein